MAQAEGITTAIRELMSRGAAAEVHKSGAGGAHRICRRPRQECAAPDLMPTPIRRTSRAAPTNLKRCSRRCTSMSPPSSPTRRRKSQVVRLDRRYLDHLFRGFRRTRWA